MQAANETKKGVINALCAYTLWGIAPIYFKLLSMVPAMEILVHRIVWSFVLLVAIVLLMGNWSKVRAIYRDRKKLAWLFFTSLILAANWLLFIWAVNNDYILEASLGYYINPLFSVALAMLFLGERLSRWQLVAVALAMVGVLIQLISLGSVPYVALGLATSFGVYGLLRKKMPVDSLPGLLIESFWMLPLGLLYWAFFAESATSNMMLNDMSLNVTLIAAGLVTTAPLLFFTAAAKRLPLTTMGFFQYVGPSIMFVLAITVYNEQLIFEKMLTFAFIWSALVIYSIDSLKKRRQRKRQANS
ncbi:EamA family transporter RarD [Thalassotalea sp. HSM 43]|uniref:EamA family transporter RarD n=1 Tax=Thalassotalea sp. HSM 43 TaxID=2552945 RepID=UPI0010816D43|nr:EamA family transporter RarD [Thalassotalea sp. HSM 43]QBY04042.1 EamA family transporter RarD [Thalassotalea sp. HSM 43]